MLVSGDLRAAGAESRVVAVPAWSAQWQLEATAAELTDPHSNRHAMHPPVGQVLNGNSSRPADS